MNIGSLKKFFVGSLALCLLFLWGCCPIMWEEDPVPYRVVTEAHVVYENGAMETRHQFFREGSVRVILEYLRHIDPYGRPAEDPETVTGRDYHITLVYSDGSKRVYHQRADMYMRIDGGEWKRIDPQKALYLSGLLGMMPNEAAPASADPIPPLIRSQI